MLTVLFVIVFLAASVGAISLLDGQRASREVTNSTRNITWFAIISRPSLSCATCNRYDCRSSPVGEEFFCCSLLHKGDF